MADARDLKSRAARHEGSNPFSRTNEESPARSGLSAWLGGEGEGRRISQPASAPRRRIQAGPCPLHNEAFHGNLRS
jgi:hypothetical protein